MAHYHHTDPGYAPPLVNPPSPAPSVTSVYGEDETDPADALLSPEEFDKKVREQIGLGQPSDQEMHANRLVMLPKPNNPQEEQMLFEHVMNNLRRQVRLLEENELFERTLSRPSQVAQTPLPSTNDIDALMRSMMGYSDASNRSQSGSNTYPVAQGQTVTSGAGGQLASGTILSGLDVFNAPVMPVGGAYWGNAPDLNDVLPNGHGGGQSTSRSARPSQPYGA
ncbi:hypothetical protein PUNSTDRAFT_131200 [Punctularia strigosozonata HHB-11173 SS5]|uniref:uncharacterized protein n=1 Tax=Punctularia strigosozonata (strain HHB-11173) TaxID=741275 RepID=UPI0004416BA6|nr:uncharacterized protein PUNSTDRAFT_131200 [Punctularia strigosozonata HHB-11173 SS5]EIN12970.1 hypothetical protein PUNSTDRAFT_131200 [Punctularia strigosozonata HHB-11173 SS5]